MSIILDGRKIITVGESSTAPAPVPKLNFSWEGVTLPKGAKGESVWQTLTPEEKEMQKPLPPHELPSVKNLLQSVTRISLILIVAMIGVMSLLQLFPVPSFRGGGE